MTQQKYPKTTQAETIKAEMTYGQNDSPKRLKVETTHYPREAIYRTQQTWLRAKLKEVVFHLKMPHGNSKYNIEDLIGNFMYHRF